METLILIVHVIVVILLIILVLLQQGKGASVGATFGGASSTMFGSQGSFSFLMKLTYVLAFTFFMTSLMLTYFSYQKSKGQRNLLTPPKSTQIIPIPESPKKPNKFP